MTNEPRVRIPAITSDTAPASPPPIAKTERRRIAVDSTLAAQASPTIKDALVEPITAVEDAVLVADSTPVIAQTEDNSVRGQFRQAVDVMTKDMLAFGAQINKPASERWEHSPAQAVEPTAVGPFGNFGKIYTYKRGVELTHWPEGVGVLVVEVTDGDNSSVELLGPTPESLGQIDEKYNPGEAGSHLMITQKSDGSEPTIGYVDKAEIEGVIVLPGQVNMTLQENQGRGRQLHFPGEVKAIQGYGN